MQELRKLETSGQKNPLLYLEYEGYSLRVVLDNSNKPWVVIGDLCEILEIRDPAHIIRKLSIKPHLSNAIIQTSSGDFNLCLLDMAGIYHLFNLFSLDSKNSFYVWLDGNLADLKKNGRVTPPKLDIDNLKFMI